MVNWCLHWINYQEAWASSCCNLLPGNRLYTAEGGLGEKRDRESPIFLLVQDFFIERHAVVLMEHANKEGGGCKRGEEERGKWYGRGKKGTSLIFIPRGNFHLFLHLCWRAPRDNWWNWCQRAYKPCCTCWGFYELWRVSKDRSRRGYREEKQREGETEVKREEWQQSEGVREKVG